MSISPIEKGFVVTRVLSRSLVLLSVIAMLAAPQPVSAGGAPSNDLITDATVIAGLPFTEQVDTSQAHGDGPAFCGNHGSVFYRFRPKADIRIQVDTLGSDYDTVLTVMRGGLANLQRVACDDDSFNVQSSIRFRAEADRNYFIEVSSCCGRGGDFGGQLEFAVQQLPLGPLSVDLAVTGGTVDTISGDVTLEGTVDCSHRTGLLLVGRLRQRRTDLYVARVFVEATLLCTAPGPWASQALEPDGPISFAAGDAKLTFDVFAFDGGSFSVVVQNTTQVVTLTE
jgi:hypothetical protein